MNRRLSSAAATVTVTLLSPDRQEVERRDAAAQRVVESIAARNDAQHVHLAERRGASTTPSSQRANP